MAPSPPPVQRGQCAAALLAAQAAVLEAGIAPALDIQDVAGIFVVMGIGIGTSFVLKAAQAVATRRRKARLPAGAPPGLVSIRMPHADQRPLPLGGGCRRWHC